MFEWIGAHPADTAWIAFAVFLFVILLIAFVQKREISLLPPRIGGKPLKVQPGSGGVMDAVRKRKSVRSYLDQPVEEEKLQALLEAARLAPSASNRQEWRFVVVRDKDILSQIAGASCVRTFIKNPPCVIAGCAKTDNHVMQCGQLSYPIDVAIALDHLTLCAADLGLGTCWIGMFDEQKVKEIIGAPGDIRVVCLMILGYPADAAAVEKKRLPMREIVRYDRWQA